MGPPRERDGVVLLLGGVASQCAELQWGRRVNATECTVCTIPASQKTTCFNGAAA